jgi:hypothetical protein
MSPVTRTLRALAVGASLLALVAGCSKHRPESPFDADSGHPADWVAKHPDAFRTASGGCIKCHGDDLMGGISKVSCYSASFNGQGCHAIGPGGHPPGWSSPSSHGAAAKAAPSPSKGFATCETCHGNDFAGGRVKFSCFDCHGVRAPHPKAPWRGTAVTHTTTDPGNAPVCAQCHRNKNPGTPGCFNNTLCHAQPGHAAGWADPAQHGAAAKGAPGDMSGFASCEICHGGNFGGGVGPTCFSCHGVSAPHAPAPWRGGAFTHTTTNQANAPVCAQCHRSSTPGSPSCFNNTLCHGPQAGHPAGWANPSQHGAAAIADLASCEACHGGDFAGGSSGQSCFPCHGWNAAHGKTNWIGGGSDHLINQNNAAACHVCHQLNPGTPNCFNNTLCHGPKGNHPAGWAAAAVHGSAAINSPGYANCQGCHGSGFSGGAGPSCFPCHGWSAAHGQTNWSGGGSHHRLSGNQAQAGICALCHRRNPGTANCFNNTLCHGNQD